MPEYMTIYRFDELTPEAQRTAIEHVREEREKGAYHLDHLRFLMENEMEHRGLGHLETFWSIFGQGRGVGLEGRVTLDDLLGADTESWTEGPGTRNVHLKPSEIRAQASEWIDDLIVELAWNLVAGCRGACTQIDDGEFWDAVERYIEYHLEDGEIDEVVAGDIRTEAGALNDLVHNYFDRLCIDLTDMLEDEVMYQDEDPQVQEFIEANMPDARFTVDGEQV